MKQVVSANLNSVENFRSQRLCGRHIKLLNNKTFFNSWQQKFFRGLQPKLNQNNLIIILANQIHQGNLRLYWLNPYLKGSLLLVHKTRSPLLHKNNGFLLSCS
uniref:Uncharacterized protein n=1 Tax=Cacopsylla melanoneura TaxID=428564 RepID=A0A8D9A2V9_9HEMI